METQLKMFTVESESGSIKELWDWSVTTRDGRVISGIESNATLAKLYILASTFRFIFTQIPK